MSTAVETEHPLPPPPRAVLLEKIQRIIGEMFGIPAANLHEQSLVVDELDLDSIDAINLIVRLEAEYGRRIDPDQFRRIKTVGDIADALHLLLAEG